MEQIDNLKELINQGDVDTAIEQLDQLLQDTSVEKEKDTLYYLRGNAYRKKGDWKQALDNYQYAIEINPDSPACLLYTSPSPRDRQKSRMPSSA